MNTIKTLTQYTLYTLLFAVLFSCGSETGQNIEQNEKPAGERYQSATGYKWDLEILKIRDCEYILWHNGYGSEMEHYEGCKNSEHCN